MATIQTHKATAERLRLRELSKYYRLANPDISDRNSPSKDAPRVDTEKPYLADDATLTALCQLATLKLGCQRSFISLIDDQTQYILAEATPSISLVDPEVHDADDQLLLGVTSLALSDGVCPLTIGVFTGLCGIEFTESGNIADKRYVVIQDLLSEGVTKDAPALAGLPPVFRYYLEVPLIAEAGHILGTLCVIDARQRPTSMSDVVKLEEIAQLVVNHIGDWRIKEDQERAHRLLESLSHFVRGQDSISQWSGTQPERNQYTETPGRRKSVQLSGRDGRSRHSAANPPRLDYFQTMPGKDSVVDGADTSASTTPLKTAFNDESEIIPSLSPTTPSEPNTTGIDFEPPGIENNTQSPSGPIRIRQAFARASNLLRQALDLDGTCFLEVPHNERFKSQRAQHHLSKINNTTSKEVRLSSESDRSEEDIPPNSHSMPQNLPADNVQCLRLGFATETKSSLADPSLANTHLSMSADLLSTLAAKYPQGHIFHFDNQGYLSSGDDSQDKTLSPTRETGKSRHMAEELRSLFRSAKSLIFCPLYDNDRQQIYAAFIGFTTNPMRALQASELVYVSAFTNSVMCEVMRLDGAAVDKAKSDFIASISHELRSPLHGVLASAQLLSEGKIYPAQKEFLHMIDNCGRSLLEVMDHLLDHAKINSYIQRTVDKRKLNTSAVKTVETFSQVSKMDLLSVVEDTALTMCTQSYRFLHHQRQSSANQSSFNGSLNERIQVPVILHLHPFSKRLFDTEIGSWRRIMMNLIGNALKYTQTGYVSVDMTVTETGRKPDSYMAKLTIFDTGQGISESYLKHRLYTPFAQENNLTVGTGLGLSMVRQIVTSLNGSIDVKSEVGVGTVFDVRIPLTATVTVSSHEADVIYWTRNEETAQLVKGVTFSFSGFDSDQPADQLKAKSNPTSRALSALKFSISQILTDWFQMQQIESETGSICIVEESIFTSNLSTYDRAGVAYIVISISGTRFEGVLSHARYVSTVPPLGPARMADILQQLFQTGLDPARECGPNGTASTALKAVVPPTPAQHDTSMGKIRPPGAPLGPLLTSLLAVTPALSRRDSASSTEKMRHTDPKQPRITILLVDDNDINLRLLIACIKRLKRPEIKYETATTGREAVDQYKSLHKTGSKINLVFMDLSMPVMDGFQATRRIRAYESQHGLEINQRSRVVALTGLASSEAQEKVERCGFDEYIRKPVDLNIVRTIVRDMLEHTPC